MKNKQYAFDRAFSQLIRHAKWNFIKDTPDCVILGRGSIELFNCETEKWNTFDSASIILYKNLTFDVSGQLSFFDVELLRYYGFEPKEKTK